MKKNIVYLRPLRDGRVAQGIEQRPSKPSVAGSNPASITNKARHHGAFFISTLHQSPVNKALQSITPRHRYAIRAYILQIIGHSIGHPLFFLVISPY